MADWWGSIRENITQIKDDGENPILRDIALVVVLILVGLSSFALGRLSASEQAQPAVPVALHTAPTYNEPPMRIGGMVVASRSGDRYHYPWCSGARSMREENKRWFNSIEDARAAGYTPAGNCRGLE